MSVFIDARRIRRNVKLKNYTTYHIGGEAERFAEVYETRDLIELASRRDENLLILGKGSNVLVSDGGFKGLVLIVRTGGVEFSEKLCVAEAGVGLSALSKRFYDNSFSGLEWACSIPGTVGGAVKMNAGAFGGCIADVLEFADVLRAGEVLRLNNAECGFSYRKSGFMPGDVILRAGFNFALSHKDILSACRKKYIEFRVRTQPSGYSAGSVFKAADKPAGWYIDNAGLKGLKIGGAAVSEKHANFIINTGSATAQNVAALIDCIKAEIMVRFGVELKEEIEYVGDF